MSALHFHPIKGKAREILKTILQTPEVSSCSMKETLALRLVCEEVVTNVVKYAYPEGTDGYLDVDIQKSDRIVLRFEDGGVPFNPLEHKKPDTTLPWKLRPIGGLGILLTLRKMSDVRYTYEDGKNVLTLEKTIKSAKNT